MGKFADYTKLHSDSTTMDPSRKLSARQCSVAAVEEPVADGFLQDHHRSGPLNAKHATSLGMFFEGELLAIAQFGNPRTPSKEKLYSTELLRLAFKSDIRVVGGASKLIAHFKKVYKPADIFTYQDATGELTNVYEHCGFTFVSQAKKKEYLVAPGKTMGTGGRKEVLGMAYAVRYGPDRILGTKLGEVKSDDGTRKSNKQIFLEELGWHVETTPGDRVYEWINPELTFYTYKITALDSDKYYFGVSHVKKKNATPEECLADGYFGSGGGNATNKFSNWKKKHKSKLIKEILSLHSRKAEAYGAEAILVANLYKDDSNCLNSTTGGKKNRFNARPFKIEQKSCSIHGVTKHHGSFCFRCGSDKAVSLNTCASHGVTKFRGNSCYACFLAARTGVKSCPVHGLSKHQGDSCYQCSHEKTFSVKTCAIHGKSKHAGPSCVACTNGKAVAESYCPDHGVSKFIGEQCYKCMVGQSIGMKECSLHGLTKHRGDNCYRCRSSSTKSQKHCEIHGLTHFMGEKCRKCFNRKPEKDQICAIHGVTKHTAAGKCRRCSVSVKEQECPIHGFAKFVSGQCRKCTTAKSIQMKSCPIHGDAKHQGDSCYKCRYDKGKASKELAN